MKTLNAILIEPGREPAICKLPLDVNAQIERIAAILDGNFASTRLFHVGGGVSLHILVNDLAVPLGLKPNRHFPEPDGDEIIFGNAVFVALADAADEGQGALDIPEHACRFFIEKLKENLKPCRGDEKPDPALEIYVENAGTEAERHFRWQEIDPPANARFIGEGRVRLVENGRFDTIEKGGRYFKQVAVAGKVNASLQ